MNWKELSLREKIGQTVMLLTTTTMYKEKFGSIKAFLEQYPVGGFYIGGEIVGGVMPGVDGYADIIDEYKKYSKYPLIVAGDLECGLDEKGMPSLPFLMALGATNNLNLGYEYGKVIANEAKYAGINWVFAPVADINTNSQNPVINVRSIGDDVERAIPMLKQIIRGIQENGVAATVKHFPGDGTGSVDAHISQTECSYTKEQWDSVYGKVYKALIDDGVDSFMTGHMSLPCYQQKNADDDYDIATLSKELTTDLLKNQLGFSGVVVTDALMMGGFGGGNCQAELRCFHIGSDVLLWPSYNYIDEMEKKILAGEISEERLNDAVSRVWDLKEKLGLFSDKTGKCDFFDYEYANNIASKVAEESLTLLSNKNGKLPLDKNTLKNVLMVGITPHNGDYELLCNMKTEFENYGVNCDVKRDIWTDWQKENECKYDIVIYAISRLPHHHLGTLDLYEHNAASVWASHCGDPNKSIVIGFGSPYVYSMYYKKENVFINAYSPKETTVKAVVKALFGDIPFSGTSPVKL